MARLSLSSPAHLARGPALRAVLQALVLVPTVMFTACLVTPTPDFQSPAQTAPFLVADSAVPKLPGILVLDASVRQYDFQALVRSEDAGKSVEVRLLVDYGKTFGLCPCQDSVPGIRIAPSTLDDPSPRTAKATWYAGKASAGCHTFTLMVSHDFNEHDCPTDSNDASSLTWFAYLCEANQSCHPNLDDMANCMFQDAPTFCPQTNVSTSSSSTGTGG